MSGPAKSVLAVIALSLVGVAPAASAEAPSLARGIVRARQMLVGLHRGSLDRASLRSAAPALRAHALSPSRGTLLGTWFVTVPGETDSDTFYAYQTFGAEGGFVETSSLLATLTEGPAHGSWRLGSDGTHYLTFELFAFDGGAPVGRIRVRCEISVDGDEFQAQSAVDVLDLDGTLVAPEVAVGPFHGTRVKTLGL